MLQSRAWPGIVEIVSVPPPNKEKRPAISPGERVARLFLLTFIIVCIFPFAGLLIAAVGSFFALGWVEDAYPTGLVGSLVLLVAVVLLATVMLGAIWLTMILECRAEGRVPRHPARMIFLPGVGIIAVGALIAVLGWIPSIFLHTVLRTFPWPLIWSCVGGGALMLYRHLDRTLPE